MLYIGVDLGIHRIGFISLWKESKNYWQDIRRKKWQVSASEGRCMVW